MPLGDYESGASFGGVLKGLFDTPNPMGSWTGLPPLLGAPLSGALLGAGAGALYGGYKKLTADPDEEPPKSITSRALIGALLGAGVGLGSGYLQSTRLGPYEQAQQDYQTGREARAHVKEATSPEMVTRRLAQDSQLSYYDRQRILQALAAASPSQWSSLLMMAGAGTLTGYAAARVLGLGLIGTMLASGAGALIARNMFGQPTTFV